MCVNTCFKKRERVWTQGSGLSQRFICICLKKNAKRIDIPLCSILQHWRILLLLLLLPFATLGRPGWGGNRRRKRPQMYALLLKKQKYLTYKLKISIHFVNTVVIINIFTVNLLKVIWIWTRVSLLFCFVFISFYSRGVTERSMVYWRHRTEEMNRKNI